MKNLILIYNSYIKYILYFILLNLSNNTIPALSANFNNKSNFISNQSTNNTSSKLKFTGNFKYKLVKKNETFSNTSTFPTRNGEIIRKMNISSSDNSLQSHLSTFIPKNDKQIIDIATLKKFETISLNELQQKLQQTYDIFNLSMDLESSNSLTISLNKNTPINKNQIHTLIGTMFEEQFFEFPDFLNKRITDYKYVIKNLEQKNPSNIPNSILKIYSEENNLIIDGFIFHFIYLGNNDTEFRYDPIALIPKPVKLILNGETLDFYYNENDPNPLKSLNILIDTLVKNKSIEPYHASPNLYNDSLSFKNSHSKSLEFSIPNTVILTDSIKDSHGYTDISLNINSHNKTIDITGKFKVNTNTSYKNNSILGQIQDSYDYGFKEFKMHLSNNKAQFLYPNEEEESHIIKNSMNRVLNYLFDKNLLYSPYTIKKSDNSYSVTNKNYLIDSDYSTNKTITINDDYSLNLSPLNIDVMKNNELQFSISLSKDGFKINHTSQIYDMENIFSALFKHNVINYSFINPLKNYKDLFKNIKNETLTISDDITTTYSSFYNVLKNTIKLKGTISSNNNLYNFKITICPKHLIFTTKDPIDIDMRAKIITSIISSKDNTSIQNEDQFKPFTKFNTDTNYIH